MGISKWRRILWLFIPLAILIIVFYLYALFFSESDYNLGRTFLNYIDIQESESKRNILTALFYLPIVGCGWLLWQSIIKYIPSKVSVKKEILAKKYENTTMGI